MPDKTDSNSALPISDLDQARSPSEMLQLNLRNFPLDRHALIEASAGTGKTYAVANLYLRFLLERRLDVSQILVVTFTEAATQELKDRIRARIKELICVFRGLESEDELLKGLYDASASPAEEVIRLTLAQRNIDQAQIYTIHGFCQQILSKHAVDIGLPLNQSLLEDERELLKLICEDFWRCKVLSFPESIINEITSVWAGPNDLAESISPILSRRAEKIFPSPFPKGIEQWLESVEQANRWYRLLQERILESQEEVRAVLEKSDLKRLKDKLSWWARIVQWSVEGKTGTLPSVGSRKNLLLEFTPGGLQAQLKAKGVVPEHSLFSFLERHLETIPVSFKDSFLVQATAELREALDAHKRNQSIVSFDDLIHLLSQVVGSKPQGEQLCEMLRSRFRVGLIDEFQDTDNDQYLIFSKIFMPRENESSQTVKEFDDQPQAKYQNLNSLILIGDPKQAIYSFRGGDISTYLRAKAELRNHARGDLYTMDTNWRSAEEMVAATNYLFSARPEMFLAEDIPFLPVNASKSLYSAKSNAIVVDYLSYEKLNKDQINYHLAEQCVERVVSCLESQDVKNHDLAILVRSANEAELMKSMLARRGLAASYEGKTNVFDSEEARAMSILMQAVAEPRNEHLMMRCMSSLFFGQSDRVLEEIQTNPEALSRYIGKFELLHELWVRHGILAMVRQFLHEFELYRYWHGSSDNLINQSVNTGSNWERSLSNLNQLAEILQKQSRKTRGMASLVRWLNEHIDIKSFTEDEGKVRLESDEQLIRIVTIHKSKGLEYPFVFLPFLFSSRSANEFWFYDDSGALCLDLLQQEKYRASVEKERLAEDVRLLYVALTRAKYRCFIGTAFYKGMQKSLGVDKTAWGRMVFKDVIPEKTSQEEYFDHLNQLVKESSGLIGLNVFTESDLEAKRIQNEMIDNSAFDSSIAYSEDRALVGVAAEQRLLERNIRKDWKVQSFTGLMHEHEHSKAKVDRSVAGFDFHSELLLLDAQRERLKSDDKSLHAEGISILDFPKGSRAGTFLHELFEDIEFSSATPRDNTVGSIDELIEYQLLQAALVPETELEPWTQFLSRWLRATLDFRLTESFCLSMLQESQYEPELEFYFPVDLLSQTQLNAMLKQYGYEGISFDTFKGHLKGAIDLVFESSGKYYLLDYKSNYLGSSLSDYGQEAMSLAMIEHRYDMQYLIYTLAFHRFLSHRLGGSYNYESDFGGVFYLFLRGLALDKADCSSREIIDQAETNSGVYFIKPDANLIKALDKLVGEGAI